MSGAGALDLARRAAPLWGGGEPRPVALSENAVFRLETPHGPVALRLHREGYQSLQGIGAELRWVAELAARGFPVPQPVATRDGQLVAHVAGRALSAVRWMEGRPVGRAAEPLAGGRQDQAELFRRIGALMGGLHGLTDSLALGANLPRPHWDAEGLLGENPLWGRFWKNAALDADARALICLARDLARERLRDRPLDYGLIHADVLRGNLLEGPQGLVLIDFDDCGYGFRGYDLGTALVESLEEPHLPLLAEALLEGYGAARPQAGVELPDLVLFTMLRSLASCGWIMSRAAPDDPRQQLYAARALRLANKLVSDNGVCFP